MRDDDRLDRNERAYTESADRKRSRSPRNRERRESPRRDRDEKRPKRDDTRDEVVRHYNARPQRDTQARQESPIFHLKALNNWIKSVLIDQFSRRGDRALDLCCGKGGDLLKWQRQNVSCLVGIDIAEVSIQHAMERYQSGRKFFPARFICLDCFTEDVVPHFKPQEVPFDIVSAQFSLHYAFESEAKIRRLLQNISDSLRPGGFFIGTIPNAYRIVKRLRAADGLSFGNGIYQIAFEQKETYPIFGHRYRFQLEDAIDDCPEYLVHFPTLEKLAKEYKLTIKMKLPFHEMFEKYWMDEKYRQLLERMNVMDEGGRISPDEWEAASIYLAFAFRRDSTDKKD